MQRPSTSPGAAASARSAPRRSRHDVVRDLEARLARARLADGGWPYYEGAASRVEPTCWGHLAVLPSSPLSGFLGTRLTTGVLADVPGAPTNYAWQGLALFTLRRLPQDAGGEVDQRLAASIVGAKGVQIEPDLNVVKQNSRLQAWPWTDNTFSWVEPTAWCMLALARGARTPAVAARLEEARAVLLDRVCASGGWNYGNSQVLRQDLRPYVPTTALALLALSGTSSHPAMATSLAWLEAHALDERSAHALALAAICLHVYGRPIGPVMDALMARDAETAFLGNRHLTAMACYALTIDRHDAVAFREGRTPR